MLIYLSHKIKRVAVPKGTATSVNLIFFLSYLTGAHHYSGAFYVASLTQWPNSSPDKMSNIWRGDLGFAASRVVPTATDNHPYSMYLVPLISY